MPHRNVWACMYTYNRATANQLSRKYGETEILRVLQSYPAKSQHHGHRSGGRGDGENSAATTNRAAAVAYINAHARPLAAVEAKRETKQGGGGRNARQRNQAQNDRLLELIRTVNHLGNLQTQLDAAEPGWRSIRVVKQAYEAKKMSRQVRFPK